MPVRSLHSAVMKWPDRDTVLAAARAWANALKQRDPTVRHVFCIGSCARGDWGVGSDIDVVVRVTNDAPADAVERRRRYEPPALPVHADLWVFNDTEWADLPAHSPHVRNRLDREALPLTD